jgi:hypothetical protein
MMPAAMRARTTWTPYVKKIVDSLPPLTGEQRDLLAMIFRSRHPTQEVDPPRDGRG